VHTNSGGSGWTHNQDILGTRDAECFGDRAELAEDGNTFVASATNAPPSCGRVHRKSGGTFSQLGVDADLTVLDSNDRYFRITGDGNAVLLSDNRNDFIAADAGSMSVMVTGTHSISAGGDPHFCTFRNEHCDFHGHCDLVLLEASHFANGKGLSVHIRSSPFKKIFSYISDVVIRIGNDILEVGGGA